MDEISHLKYKDWLNGFKKQKTIKQNKQKKLTGPNYMLPRRNSFNL